MVRWQAVSTPQMLPQVGDANPPMIRGVMGATRNLTKGEVENLKRAYNGFLYDTQAFLATNGAIDGSRKLQFFTAGLGSGATSPVYGVDPKTEVDTNLNVSGGQMAQSQAFLAYGLGFQVFPQIASQTIVGGVTVDLANFNTLTPFQFIPNDTQAILYGFLVIYGSSSIALKLGVLGDWPAGYGVYAATGGVGPSQDSSFGGIAGNGWPSREARNEFDVPKDFSSGEDFRISSTNPNVMPSMITAAGTDEDPVYFTWVVKASYWGVWRDRV